MHERVGRYRHDVTNPFADYIVGCRIVVQPIFFPEDQWIPQPESWAPSIVVGKTYSTDDREGMQLWERIVERNPSKISQLQISEPEQALYGVPPQLRYGEPALVKPRLGQGAFRVAVIDAYHRSCAVSGGKVLPALDAAHIKPYAFGGIHELSNGILLRRDIHSVFDAGYVTIDEQYRFVVSDKVKTDFNNGNEYRRLHGTVLSKPATPLEWPDLRALRWHNENVFRDNFSKP